MAQAQVTLKLEPMELVIIQEALQSYLVEFDGDDSGPSKTRKYTAKGILAAIGVGLPPQNGMGMRQVSFIQHDQDE